MLRELRAASAVSYGAPPGQPDHFQPGGDRLWAALQRELVTLRARWWSGRSFRCLWDQTRRAMSDLAVAGALLLLGVPPEELRGRGRGLALTNFFFAKQTQPKFCISDPIQRILCLSQ